MREFRALLPEPEREQNAILRGLALKDGVRSKPEFPQNALLKWLDERSAAAHTHNEKRATLQDFLIVARPLVRLEDRTQRRRGLKAAQKAIELAGSDIGLRADIATAFLAPSLMDSDIAGPFSPGVLLQDLWPRFGRIITLEIQTQSQIAAMQQAAQTGPSDVPPLQIGTSSTATMPFLKIMATVPGPRQGWAIYRLTRLLREQGEKQQAREWFSRLQFGDGAGIFLRQNQIYDPAAKPVGAQDSYNIDREKDEREAGGISEFAAPSWKTAKSLLPVDVAAAQTQFLSELKDKARTADAKRAPIYSQLAENLAQFVGNPQETDVKAIRRTTQKIDAFVSGALMAFLKADGAANIHYFKATDDAALLARAGELFILTHFESLSGVNYVYGSRYDAIKSVASNWVLAGNAARALPMLELWSAISYPGNHWAQALDLTSKVLRKEDRLEDALLSLEAIPADSGMGGGLVWSAPEIRREWSVLVQQADRSAVVYERQTPELKAPEPKLPEAQLPPAA